MFVETAPTKASSSGGEKGTSVASEASAATNPYARYAAAAATNSAVDAGQALGTGVAPRRLPDPPGTAVQQAIANLYERFMQPPTTGGQVEKGTAPPEDAKAAVAKERAAASLQAVALLVAQMSPDVEVCRTLSLGPARRRRALLPGSF